LKLEICRLKFTLELRGETRTDGNLSKTNVNTTDTPPQSRPRLPEWLRFQLPVGLGFGQTRAILEELKLHTVCQSAKCPNHWECWSRAAATFMIAGDHCTRACGFCAVTTAKPLPLEPGEPARVAEGVRRLNLKHVVVTAVARDDLPDGGAGHFGQTVEMIRQLNPKTVIEVLVPDFLDKDAAIKSVLAAGPDIFNHNLETVRRLTPSVRHRATYDRSLSVLAKVKAWRGDGIVTKSGLMLGLGETEEELLAALADLRGAGCDLLTLGQYLQPTLRHLPVVAFISPARFAHYKTLAEQLGFLHVASGPMVRSSYHADEFNLPDSTARKPAWKSSASQ
jgi:lipoic acid synthetase